MNTYSLHTSTQYLALGEPLTVGGVTVPCIYEYNPVDINVLEECGVTRYDEAAILYIQAEHRSKLPVNTQFRFRSTDYVVVQVRPYTIAEVMLFTREADSG